MEMIEISQMDIFNLLDHNQDGQLQLKEVRGIDWGRFAGHPLAHPLMVTHVLGWGQTPGYTDHSLLNFMPQNLCWPSEWKFLGNVQQLSCYWEAATVLGRTVCFQYVG